MIILEIKLDKLLGFDWQKSSGWILQFLSLKQIGVGEQLVKMLLDLFILRLRMLMISNTRRKDPFGWIKQKHFEVHFSEWLDIHFKNLAKLTIRSVSNLKADKGVSSKRNIFSKTMSIFLVIVVSFKVNSSDYITCWKESKENEVWWSWWWYELWLANPYQQ